MVSPSVSIAFFCALITFLGFSRLEPIIYSYMMVSLDEESSSLLSVFQNPKQADLIGRHVHSLLLFEKYVPITASKILDSEIGSILSTCASLRNLAFPASVLAPQMMFNLLEEHAYPTLRRMRITWHWTEVSYPLSRIPQTTLQNLTHFELYTMNVPPCDESYWHPLRSTSLQYLSFNLYGGVLAEFVSLIQTTFSQRPPTLKALILALRYDPRYDERCWDEIDAWFFRKQNDPKSSAVILARLATGGIRTGALRVSHKVWGSWEFLMHASWNDERYYDICEEMLPDEISTVWEQADCAWEERRSWLASQVNEVAQD
jgi:hypothetical protein